MDKHGEANPTPGAPAAEVIGHFIDGAEQSSEDGRTFVTTNPATREPLARVAFAGAMDVDRAVQSAKRAFRSGSWTRVPPARRSEVLRNVATLIRRDVEAIAVAESRDSGKPLLQARNEVTVAAGFFDYFAGHAMLPNGRSYPVDDGYFAYSTREPYGVVAAISPWNYPFLLACWKSAPALAAGNCVVLKMARETPMSTSMLARLAAEAGIPPGVFNVVHGDGPITGDALVRHPDVAKITFTGSTEVGQGILRAAADDVKSVHLELGGKTPNLVFDDADLDQAVSGSLFTAFYNAGQICTSGSRLLVERSRAATVVEALAARAGQLRVGDPQLDGTQVGPVVSQAQQDRIHGYIEEGLRGGARLVTGGRVAPQGPGYFVAPTIFADVTPEMRIAKEEIFGPVLSVLTFSTEAEAIEIANQTMYGLAATVWTTDLGRAFRLARALEAGIIWTNSPHYLPVNVPYEGHKMSGLGEDLGVEALHEFTRLKTHIINYAGTTSAWG